MEHQHARAAAVVDVQDRVVVQLQLPLGLLNLVLHVGVVPTVVVRRQVLVGARDIQRLVRAGQGLAARDFDGVTEAEPDEVGGLKRKLWSLGSRTTHAYSFFMFTYNSSVASAPSY